LTIAPKVEFAFGADLTVNSGGWTWTDVSTYALGQAQVRFGRIDEASTTSPATLQLRLKNTDGRFTPHGTSSPTWPYMRRQTPVRYSINPGTGFVQVFQGFVDEVSPVWPAGNSQYAEVSITASGSLRRLSQGSPVLQSAIYRSTIAAHPQLYAPMEEESGATQFATQGSKTKVPVLRSGTVSFGGDSTLPGSARAAVLTATSYLSLETSAGKYTGQWQFDFFLKFPSGAPAAETIVMRVYTTSAAAFIVDAVYGGGGWGLRIYDQNGASATTAVFGLPAGLDVGWWHWRLMGHDIGGTAEHKVVVFPFDLSSVGFVSTTTVAGTGPGSPQGATVFPSAGMTGVAMAHWACYDRWDFSAVDASADGYDGEDAVTRLRRLCREEGIELSFTGTSTILMGPQRPNSVMTLLRECETADGGILYDGVAAGLSYLAESSRYNPTATLALDVSRNQVKVPFSPTEDDQHLANDWTVSSPAGLSEQFIDQDHVDANGRYQSSATINVNSAGALQDAAAWRAHLGTVDEMRVAQLSLQLVDHPELWAAALALRPGHTVTVDRLLTQYPPGALGVVVEGWSATIDATIWRMDLNCSPASPWNVGVFDSNWWDCGASVLGTALTASSVGASVSMDVLVSDNCDWTHAFGDYSITVGGEEMTVTGVGATTTPTPALVAVGTSASSDGFSTRFVTPGIPGGATAAGNLLLMFASCRDTNAIDTDMYLTGAPGWTKILDGVNYAFFAKVHSGSETAPTLRIPPFTTIVGDTLVAQIASFTGKWGDPKSQLIASASQFNAAAQDIAYPALPVGLGGVLLIWAGWKADDWTSVATLGGITEIGEPSSTAGNDAGIVWDYNNSVGVPTIGGGSFVVTGGTSQISRGVVFALRSYYQTLTVTRGANGITRAHALGEAVHVSDPLIFTRQ
jgi:hypothetical protein